MEEVGKLVTHQLVLERKRNAVPDIPLFLEWHSLNGVEICHLGTYSGPQFSFLFHGTHLTRSWFTGIVDTYRVRAQSRLHNLEG